ncbi:unnamed protein product, partial [marine sediment metagenome]
MRISFHLPIILFLVFIQSSCIQLSNLDSAEVTQIYSTDNQVRAKEKKLRETTEQSHQVLREERYERAKELKGKGERLEKELKDLKINLDNLLAQHRKNWEAKPLWQRLSLELSANYTYFDDKLHLEDVFGTRLRLHWVKEEFRHFHLGYLYYPLQRREEFPLRKIYASPFLLEYRHSKSETILNNRKKDVYVNSYLMGFGLSGQVWNEAYINLSLSAGIQHYSGTEPNDTGPIVSYTMGFQQT